MDIHAIDIESLRGFDASHDDSAEAFHEQSRNYRRHSADRPTQLRAALEQGTFQPTGDTATKSYAHLPRLDLGEADASTLSMSLALALERRVSARATFHDQPLTGGRISTLLWATYGRRGSAQRELRRTVPSAGALYPLGVYIFIRAAKDLASGIYF